MSKANATATRMGMKRMLPRDPTQVVRAASPLELFFDLIFVVAVSLSSAQLHHLESGVHIGSGILSYLMVFFAIWWAWMNFTWFASAFDTDDWAYRVLALTQMAGVVVLAVGTGPAMESSNFGLVITGYVIMRLALVAQWLRASRSRPDLRKTARKYAIGIVFAQLLWICFPLVAPDIAIPVFVALALLEMSVPLWAEATTHTPWHPAHIAERFGCFTLIVLGESVLASTTTIAEALRDTEHLTGIIIIGASGFVLAAGMWWVYFAVDVSEGLDALRRTIPFGYGHYFIFAAAGAFSAGISVLLDHTTGETTLSSVTAAATLTVPVAIFVLAVWALILRKRMRGASSFVVPFGCVLLAACAFVPAPTVCAAVVMVMLVAVVERHRIAEAA